VGEETIFDGKGCSFHILL